MARYAGEFSAAGVNSADAVLFNLKAGATVPLLVEKIFFNIEVASTNAPIYGLKKMNAVGTGAITTATLFVMDGLGGTSAASLETAWATTRPTITGGSPVRGAVPNAIGNGFLFDFTNAPLVISVNTALCGVMRNASGATTGTHGGYVIWTD
jgi:hypothetical protein